ncbi:hypothetical protein D3C81_1597700 [compost metagenome]
MVVTSAPTMLLTGITQERTAAPFMCTVQAPHRAMPQPNLVPVMPSTSRSTQSSGVSGSTSTLCSVPLIFRVRAISPPSGFHQDGRPSSRAIQGWPGRYGGPGKEKG